MTTMLPRDRFRDAAPPPAEAERAVASTPPA
jgi:hypothetical protein